MPDVQSVMDRLYRAYLEPPVYQPMRCFLINTVSTTTATGFQLGNFAVAEDKMMLRNGLVLEVGDEMLVVQSIDSLTATNPTVTVLRAQYGTTASTYTPGTEIRMSPLFPKQSSFEAIRDNIISLHPKLFTVRQAYVVPVGDGVYPCDDPLAVSVQSAWPHDANHRVMLGVTAQIVDYHPLVDGRAFVAAGCNTDLWIRYHRRMGVATSMTDELDNLGVEDVWVPIVLAGAAADLMVGRDLPETVVDWVTKAVDTEAVSVGSRQSLAIGLRRYRDYLLNTYAKEMQSEYKPVVVARNPFRQAQRL